MSLKLKRSLITVLSALVLVFASVGIFLAPTSPIKTNAEVITAQVDGVDENYIINAKEVFPVSITEPISAGDGVVIYPNGKAYKIVENKEFLLNVAGEYTLRYFGENNQVVEKSFVVSQKYFVLSTEETDFKNDIVAATKEVMAGQMLPSGGDYPEDYAFKRYENDTAWPNIEQNLTTLGNEGLIVRMEAGTKFNYSVPIDLTNAGSDGLTNIIKFQPRWGDYDRSKPTTSANYIMDLAARHIVITLTDCYDSSRYIRFLVQEGGDTNYARAGTDNLIDAGWVFPTTRQVTSDMAAREFYEGTQYGFAYIGKHGTGTPAGNVNEWVRRDGFHLKYDYENARVWVTSHDTSGVNDYKEVMVTDFKNKSVYPSADFRGFTTGEVYLSIEFTDYQTPNPARVDIFEIAGMDATELIKMRGVDQSGNATEMLKDAKDPVINVDYSPTKSGGVFADVGTDFTIPSAQVYDVNLKTSSVMAYRNYYDPMNRVNVPIVDGKIQVTEDDTYVIVYYAEDANGNSTEKLIKVFGVKDKDNPAVYFSCGDKLADLKAGESNVLPKFIFETRNNIVDRKLKITVYSDKESIVIADLKNGQEIEEFLAQENTFLLSNSGEYTMEYAYSDNAISNVESYELTVGASNIVTFPDKPLLQRYLIKDATYDFDEIYAYSYITGEQAPYKVADVYIAYDENVDEANVANSTFTKLTSVFSNKITGSEKAVLKYVCEDNVIYSDVAKIVDTNISTLNKLQQHSYFVGDIATAHPDDATYDATLFDPAIYYPSVNGKNVFDASKLDIKAKATSGNCKMEFANMIDISKFSFYYRILNESDARIDADNFNALRLVFTDPYNMENQVYAKLYRDGDNIYLDLNNEQLLKVTQVFSGSVDKSFTYNLSTGMFSVSGGAKSLSFDFGFTTSKAYLDIVIEDIFGTAGLRILELNGHKFSHSGAARTLPTSLMTIPQGNYEAGTVVTITPAEFVDVLSPIIKAKVTLKVTDPNGKALKALDGTVLDGTCDPYKGYKVKLNDLGQYKVAYVATSGLNQRTSPPGFISVGDLTAPEITFEGDITENCVVYLRPNQKLEVKYSVSDDTSLPENIFARIVWTNREASCARLIDGNIVSFVNEGEYVVGVSCADELGNFSRKTFTVIVTKGEIK